MSSLLAERLGAGFLVVTVNGTPVPLELAATVTITRAGASRAGGAEPAACTLTLVDPPVVPQLGDDLVVTWSEDALDELVGLDPVARDLARYRFVGHVADPVLTLTADRSRVSLTATSARARLNRTRVGDEPWPAEPAHVRAARVRDLAAARWAGTPPLVVDGAATGWQVLARDVDAQPAGTLLDQVAESSDAGLLERRDGTLAWVPQAARGSSAVVVDLPAEAVLAPAVWRQNLAELVNRVRVSYGGSSSSVEVGDPTSEDRHGLAEGSLSTQLVGADDAGRLALDLVGRYGRPLWRLPAVSVRPLHPGLDELLDEDTADQIAAGCALLDVDSLVRITGLPATGPRSAGLYWLAGLVETFEPRAWRVELDLADYGLLAPPVTWVDELDTLPDPLSWDDVPEGLSWLAATSWHPNPTPTDSWRDTSVTDTWAGAPADLTWED